MRRLFLFSAFIISIGSFKILNAQQNSVELKGTVFQDTISLENISILNLRSKNGVLSDRDGKFSIKVKHGDSLLFKSLTHKERHIKIAYSHINNQPFEVYLEPIVYELKEIQLGQPFQFKSSEIYIKNMVLEGTPDLDLRKTTDPNFTANHMDIVQIAALFLKKIFKKSIETKKENIRISKIKNDFSNLIYERFGINFFTEDLNIQPDKVQLFINYCRDNGLREYYISKEIEIINFLVVQSLAFNEL